MPSSPKFKAPLEALSAWPSYLSTGVAPSLSMVALAILGALGYARRQWAHRAAPGGSEERHPLQMAMLSTGEVPDETDPANVETMVQVLRRTAWVPFVEQYNPAMGGRNQFGGVPALQPREAWPECGKSGKPMHLFLQLDLAQIPEDMQPTIGGSGLLQVFISPDHIEEYCGATETPEAGAKLGYLVRVIPTEQLNQAGPAMGPSYEPMSITFWHPVDDYPMTVDEVIQIYPKLGKSDRLSAWDGQGCVWGEKMGGWPMWTKGPGYMTCRECDAPMQVIFQFDSDVNMDYVWGNRLGGTAFVHQCPHCGKFGFSWNHRG